MSGRVGGQVVRRVSGRSGSVGRMSFSGWGTNDCAFIIFLLGVSVFFGEDDATSEATVTVGDSISSHSISSSWPSRPHDLARFVRHVLQAIDAPSGN